MPLPSPPLGTPSQPGVAAPFPPDFRLIELDDARRVALAQLMPELPQGRAFPSPDPGQQPMAEQILLHPKFVIAGLAFPAGVAPKWLRHRVYRHVVYQNLVLLGRLHLLR